MKKLTLEEVSRLTDAEAEKWQAAERVAGVCRVCGCTDARPCILDPDNNAVAIDDGSTTLPMGHTTCSWIEPDLCSGCVQDKAPALLYDVDGNPIGRAP